VPPAAFVVVHRVFATAPVAEADYSLQKRNGPAEKRYAGGGRGEAGRGVGKTAPPHNCSYFSSAITSVAPAATSAELHCSAAADATGDGRAPAADVVACAAPSVASGVSATAAPAAAGGGTAIAIVSATVPTSTAPLSTAKPARANCAGPPPEGPERGRVGGWGGQGTDAALRSDGARAGAVQTGADSQGSKPPMPVGVQMCTLVGGRCQ